MVASTTSMIIVPHQEWEAVPRAPTGSTRSSATLACACGDGRSDCHSQAMMPTMASRPQAQATSVSLTVSSRKNPAVPAAATSGHQLSPGKMSR